MAISWRLIATVAGIFVVALVLSALATCVIENNTPAVIPMALSLTALIVSIVGVFKGELFTFNPQVFWSDLCIVNTTEDNSPTPGFLVALDFLNRGYGEGFIEDLIIRTTKDGKSFCMRPVMEVDSIQLVRDKGKLTLGPRERSFIGFPLGSKACTRKFMLFLKDGAKVDIEAGMYSLEVFAQTSEAREPWFMLKFEVSLDDAKIKALKTSGSIGLMYRKINEKDLPASNTGQSPRP